MEFIAIGVVVVLFVSSAYLFCETGERAYHERRHYQNHKRRLKRRAKRRQRENYATIARFLETDAFGNPRAKR